MKKYLICLFFVLFFASLVSAKLITPAPDGLGIYGELSDNNTWTGDNTFDGEFRGSGPNEWLGAGKKTVEQAAFNNTDYTQSSWSLKNGTTVDDSFDGFQRLTQGTNANDFLGQNPQQIITTANRTWVANMRVKAVGDGEGDLVQFRFFSSPNTTETYGLPNDQWTWMHIDMIYLGDSTINISLEVNNAGLSDDFTLDIAEINWHERTVPAMYSDGDSLATGAYETWMGSNVIKGHSYTNKLAADYHIDYDNRANGGNTLATIATRVETNLAGKTYPIVLIEGGVNDVAGWVTDDSSALLTTMDGIIVDCKLSSDNCVVSDVPLIPNLSEDQKTWGGYYNTKLYNKYKNDTKVKIIQTNTFLDMTTDVHTDNIHLKISGQKKWYEAIKAAQPLPTCAETYENPVSGSGFILDTNTSKKTERVNYDPFILKTITEDYTAQGNYLDRTFRIDASSADRTVTLTAVPEHGEEYNFECKDDGSAAYNCIIGRNGNTIDGTAADLSISEDDVVNLKFDSEDDDWFYFN